jgi:hypothetical protein
MTPRRIPTTPTWRERQIACGPWYKIAWNVTHVRYAAMFRLGGVSSLGWRRRRVAYPLREVICGRVAEFLGTSFAMLIFGVSGAFAPDLFANARRWI